VFTDADQDYVKDLLRHSFYPDPVNAICNYMLEENNYLRIKKPDPIPLPGPSLPPASPLQVQNNTHLRPSLPPSTLFLSPSMLPHLKI